VKEAAANGTLVAGPDAPDRATCPGCGTEVRKRSRKRMDGRVTYLFGHKRGQGMHCPRRYRPT
jgi:hypothetical protein